MISKQASTQTKHGQSSPHEHQIEANHHITNEGNE